LQYLYRSSFSPPTASDSCGASVSVSFSDLSYATLFRSTGIFTRTWHATDCSGNTSSPVSQTITVVDSTNPTIGGQGADDTIQCPNTPVFSPPTASDSCDVSVSVSFSYSSTAGSCAGTGTFTRTWHATDCSG